MLVSRVPNTKQCTLWRSLVMACMKCKNMREYWFIEPEISQRITSGGGRRFGFLSLSGTTSGERSAARKVARISICVPCAARLNRRVGKSITGNRNWAMACLATAISSADIFSKSFSCSTSFSEKVKLASNSTLLEAASELLVELPLLIASLRRRLISSSSSSCSIFIVGNMAPINRSMI